MRLATMFWKGIDKATREERAIGILQAMGIVLARRREENM